MNLVFNRWDDNGNPLPNLSELNTEYNTFLFPFFINDISFNIQKCRLEDINKNEKFYFIITQKFSYSFYIKHGEIFLPKEIEQYIKNYNLKIIFLSEHESNKYVDIFMHLLIKKIKKNNWKEENFYIIDNNSMLYKLKDKLKTNINVFKINFLIKFFTSKYNNNNIDENHIKFDKKFIFLCQNRNPHYHRILFLTYLKHLSLFENNIINWSLLINQSDYLKYNINSPNILSLSHFKNYLDINNKSLIEDYKFICDTDKKLFYDENINFDNIVNVFDYNSPLMMMKWGLNSAESYINIVTESHYHFRENDVHITEKSFKPFYYFQLPLFLASYQHIKMMREEYNLDFFDDLIDHSYDDEIDDAKRFHMIIKEVQRLSTMREEISEFYKNNINRLIHNHNFIKNNNYEEVFKEYILNI
jgi:hypothetical protein